MHVKLLARIINHLLIKLSQNYWNFIIFVYTKDCLSNIVLRQLQKGRTDSLKLGADIELVNCYKAINVAYQYK